jgi:hypothetical protein
VIALFKISCQLLADVLWFVIVALRPTRDVAAENLFLRRQLAMYVERGARPRRPDVATRVSLALLSKLFDWRASLLVVRPETLIRWHRAGFSAAVAHEVAPWPTRNLGRTTSSDPTHGRRESALGRRADCQ